MKFIWKVAVILVAVVVVTSVGYIGFITINENNDSNNDGSGNPPPGPNPDENETDHNTTEEFVHSVLIEEGTATTCQYCPNVADILRELYTSGNYRFYYVALVEDQNTKASDRLNKDYNKYGLPTVFIDGGYNVIVGGTNDKQVYSDAISAAESRPVPSIRVIITAEYDNTTKKINSNILLENKENSSYNGKLKVYLTEIVSRWNDYNGKPYEYAFIDYLTTKDTITIPANGNYTLKPDPYAASDLDPENLMVVAAVFNTTSTQGYANPPDSNPFTAYYADAVNGTEVVKGGDLPPEIGISSPQQGKIYLRGNEFLKFLYKNKLLKNTFLIGTATITAYAKDDHGITKVEFYLDDKLQKEITEEPYEWSFRKAGLIKRIIHKHTITVKAYDTAGKTSEANMDVITIFI